MTIALLQYRKNVVDTAVFKNSSRFWTSPQVEELEHKMERLQVRFYDILFCLIYLDLFYFCQCIW